MLEKFSQAMKKINKKNNKKNTHTLANEKTREKDSGKQAKPDRPNILKIFCVCQ